MKRKTRPAFVVAGERLYFVATPTALPITSRYTQVYRFLTNKKPQF